jgi:hypothetical protein
MATKIYNTKTVKNSPGSVQTFLKTTPKAKFGVTKPSHFKKTSMSTDMGSYNIPLEQTQTEHTP